MDTEIITDAALDVSFWGLIIEADFVVKIVMIILLIASIWSWAIIFDKSRKFIRLKKQANIFESAFWSGDSLEELYEKQRQERIKRLNESSGLGHQVFNNVTQIPETDSKSPLSGIKSNDAGVDISEIEKLSNGKWKTLTGGK